jgi:hypothetical protein
MVAGRDGGLVEFEAHEALARSCGRCSAEEREDETANHGILLTARRGAASGV